MSNTSIIEVRNVSKSYRKRPVLKNLSLELPAGIIGLLGPNGAGKSTLIKSILGLIQIDSGSGHVMGLQWPRLSREIRDRIGYLPEDDCFIHGLQGIESIQMMARLSGLPKTEGLRRAHEVADFCDIEQERYRQVETYSTGMRQKLKFAQALVHDPPLIILDEPTTGLDPAQRELFLERMRTLATTFGKSILISTHILQDVQKVCDHVVIVSSGSVIVSASLKELQQPVEPGLNLTLARNRDAYCEKLRAKSIRFELVGSNQLTIQGITDDDCPLLWQMSDQAAAPISRLDVSQCSLEQMYRNAVGGKN